MNCVNEIKLSPSSVTLILGNWYYDLHAEVLPADAACKHLTWSSSDEEVATVNEQGYIMPRMVGTTTIYAHATDGSGVFGSCTVTVAVTVETKSVVIVQDNQTIGVGDTIYLSAVVCPQNATARTVRWESSNPGVATVGRYSGWVTGVAGGTAEITATTTDGRKSEPIVVTVDPREKVIVERDSNGNYGRIVFSNGKVWNCIHRDLINDYALDENDPFSQRFYDNAYQRKIIDGATQLVTYREPMKEYTNEEIKLIYTLDPYGLAAYVKEYGSHVFLGNLKSQLEYKDSIFYLIFKRHPKYYKRNLSGTWYETTDTSELNDVLSESEFLFGCHPIYDLVTLKEVLVLVVDLFTTVLGSPALKSINVLSKMGKILTYFTLGCSVAESILNEDFNGFVSAIATGFITEENLEEKDLVIPAKYKTKNYSLKWVFFLLSLGRNLGALAETFNSGPHFYKEIFTYCNNELNYNIIIRTDDNKLIPLANINNLIN